MVAIWYEEIVVERIYDGTTQLNRALRPLIEGAESCLELDEAKRKRTILRVDSGGGSVEDINWALERSYRIHIKDYSGSRATQLAKSVQHWFTDPVDPARHTDDFGRWYGFAGGWEDWQFGYANNPSEIFADMFIGWVYGQWDFDLPNNLGYLRLHYMELTMGHLTVDNANQ